MTSSSSGAQEAREQRRDHSASSGATRSQSSASADPNRDGRSRGRSASDSNPPRSDAKAHLIEQLSAAVVSTARGVRGRWFFLGWTDEELPAATTKVEELSAVVRKDVAAFRGAGLSPRQVPFASIIPVSYVMTGPAIDFADTADRRAEDQVNYTVIDAAGERREIAIGELALLGAIAAARDPWQSHQTGAANELAVDAVPFYTLFANLPGVRADTGLAMLFQSTLSGKSNMPAYQSFVRQSLGRLLVLDESQSPASRKGYLEVAGKMAGVPPKSGVLQSLVWMRRAGLVSFEDSWLQGMQGRGKRMKGGLIRALRGMGMVEVSDAYLAEMSDTRPDYNVDQLDLDRMIRMADEMYKVAREQIVPRKSTPRSKPKKAKKRKRR